MYNKISSAEAELPQKMLEEALNFLELQSFASGAMIVSPANDPHIFYYVRQGTVEVSYSNQDDTRITVALIGAGDFFGEIGYFDGETRVRNILAAGDVEVGIFTTEVMNRIKESDLSLYIKFIMHLTQRICQKFRRIAGENEPLAAYADSLSSKRSSMYTVSKPLPASLLHSSPWHFISTRMEKFKAELFDLSHQLQRNESIGNRDVEVEERCLEVLGELTDSLSDFKQTMAGTGYEDVMWGYVFKEVFPYFMRSRFAERAYFKPKGYAGDFLMMEHIYANEPKGEGKLGEIIDSFCLKRPGSLAIRGRRKLLAKEISRICSSLFAEGKNTRIMNLACGPNRELFDFLQQCEDSQKVEALCVDIDSEALQYTNQFVNIFPHNASIRLMSENVIKWSLGRTSQQFGTFDIIYSAGLCDYLDTRLFRALITQCYNHLNPGGTVILGNFAVYTDSIFLDKLLRWELIYRNVDDLKELFAPTPFKENVLIISEKENVNLFAIATKD
jgi:CRP-like cAMP-binding protein/chemotaxis methyl-accepting protein methylase